MRTTTFRPFRAGRLPQAKIARSCKKQDSCFFASCTLSSAHGLDRCKTLAVECRDLVDQTTRHALDIRSSPSSCALAGQLACNIWQWILMINTREPFEVAQESKLPATLKWSCFSRLATKLQGIGGCFQQRAQPRDMCVKWKPHAPHTDVKHSGMYIFMEVTCSNTLQQHWAVHKVWLNLPQQLMRQV